MSRAENVPGRAETVAKQLRDVNLLIHNAGLFTGAGELGSDVDCYYGMAICGPGRA